MTHHTKFIFLILIACLMTSCERICPYCGEYGHCRCYIVKKPNYQYDYFCSDKLIGNWQCSYNMTIGTRTLKSIKFFDGRKCDILYSERQEVDWFSETYIYSYDGKYIRFSRNGMTFQLHVCGYLYPELYVEDSFGKYVLRKT